jgi:hypothetical protein
VRKVKKVVLVPVMALALLLMATPVMARAIPTPVTGEYFGWLSDPGKQWISEEGIIQVRDGVGIGTLTGDIPGMMTFIFNAAFDPTTGEGRIWGKFVSSDNYGNTFKGTFVSSVSYWGNYIAGRSVGRGTGAFEGMLLRNAFSGYNAYFGLPPPPYPQGTPIYFRYEGTVLGL